MDSASFESLRTTEDLGMADIEERKEEPSEDSEDFTAPSNSITELSLIANLTLMLLLESCVAGVGVAVVAEVVESSGMERVSSVASELSGTPSNVVSEEGNGEEDVLAVVSVVTVVCAVG